MKNFENFDEKSRSDINDKSILRKSLTEKHDDDVISYRGESPDYKSSEVRKKIILLRKKLMVLHCPRKAIITTVPLATSPMRFAR